MIRALLRTIRRLRPRRQDVRVTDRYGTWLWNGERWMWEEMSPDLRRRLNEATAKVFREFEEG